MAVSGDQRSEQAAGGGGGLRGDSGEGFAADIREDLSGIGDVGGFGEEFAVGAAQEGLEVVRQIGGQVGGVGFQQKPAGGGLPGVLAGAGVFGAGQGAPEGNEHVFVREGGQGVGGAGVGMDKESGGMGGAVEQQVQHPSPGVAAMNGDGEGEFAGQVELGEKHGFAVGIQAVVHAAVESDFADAGGPVGEEGAEGPEPGGTFFLNEPRMQAEGGDDEAGMGVGEGGDGRPIGFAGGGGVKQDEAGGAGAGDDVVETGGEARILQVAVGVGPMQILSVRRGRRCYGHGCMVKGRPISVNAQSGSRRCRGGWVPGLALGLALVWAGAGCGTFSYYPEGMEHTTLTPLRTGQRTGYERTFAKRTEGRDGMLFAMEMGRVAQLEGDLDASRSAFEKAIAAWETRDDQAVVSASGAGAQAGAVLVNDKAIPYRAPEYERALVHHYQTLNYLATNDLIGAGVEVRRANLVQEAAREKREGEIERAASGDSRVPEGEEGDPSLLPVYAGLDEIAGGVKHSFQNAATFYLSGVVWEMLGERNDAYIDYKKALEIFPDNLFLQADVMRLGKRLGMREDVADFQRRFPQVKDMPADGTGALEGKARLVVLYEEGLAPKKSEMSVAYPLGSADSIGAVALPVYAEAFPGPVPVGVTVGGRRVGSTAPICSVGALAARSLAERMPGIVTRQVARAITKGVAAKAAKDSGGGWAELAVTLYNVISEQADLRSWLTLPAHIHVLSAWVEPGCRRVVLQGPGGGEFWEGEVTLAAGRTTLVVVTRIDLAVYSRSIMPQ